MRAEKELTLELMRYAEKQLQQTAVVLEKDHTCVQTLTRLVYIHAILTMTGHYMISEQLRRSMRIILHHSSPDKRLSELDRMVELYCWSRKFDK